MMHNDLTSDVIESTLHGLAKRLDATSRNIANMNTPLYAREEVTFEDQLREVIDGPKVLPLVTTDPMHISNVTRNVPEVSPIGTRIKHEPYTGDGNSVDPETETARLARTRMMYDALSIRMGKKFSDMKRVMTSITSA